PVNPSKDVDANFSFIGADAGGGPVTFLCQLDGNAQTSCTSSQPYTNLAEGGHSFSVIAVDVAGNQSLPATYNWTIDITIPTVQITAHPVNPSNSVDADFSFIGADAGGGPVTFLCQLDGNTQTSCPSPQPYTNLAEGGHSFSVIAVDVAGN